MLSHSAGTRQAPGKALFALDICNMPSPLFTGLPAMMQILPLCETEPLCQYCGAREVSERFRPALRAAEKHGGALLVRNFDFGIAARSRRGDRGHDSGYMRFDQIPVIRTQHQPRHFPPLARRSSALTSPDTTSLRPYAGPRSTIAVFAVRSHPGLFSSSPQCFERRLCTLGGEVQHRLNLIARHVEVFKNLLHWRRFQILENRRHGDARTAKQPDSADFAGDALHGGALCPIETCHAVCSVSPGYVKRLQENRR